MKRIFLIILLVVALASICAFFYFHNAVSVKIGEGTVTSTPATATTSTPAYAPRQAPAGQSEYHNSAYGFSLFYPSNLSVKEYDEGGGEMTISFQNTDTAQGFQLFISPYSEAQVSAERFREDEPSGVMLNMQKQDVDGATGAAFFSQNPALGSTREVWFIHGGYLYEATTLKSLDQWMQNILATWKFI